MRKWIAVLAFLIMAPLIHKPVQAQTHAAVLTWGASVAGTCSGTPTLTYNVFRGTTAGGEAATPINSTGLNSLTYSDTTVVLGTTYFYRVQATEVCGNFTLPSVFSNEVTAVFPSTPTAPTLQAPVVN